MKRTPLSTRDNLAKDSLSIRWSVSSEDELLEIADYDNPCRQDILFSEVRKVNKIQFPYIWHSERARLLIQVYRIFSRAYEGNN